MDQAGAHAREPAREAPPSRLDALTFELKVAAHRLRRSLLEAANRPAKHAQQDPERPWRLIAEVRSPLLSDARAGEAAHQRGKVQNLRRAQALLDRTLIPAGEVFSFWRQLGRASRGRGFTAGRMLQQGCLVPSVGGGLCQLSNALYQAALQAGCDIVERHAHSRVVPGSAAEAGEDATVAWNYVDLRFRAPSSLRLSVRLTRDELVVGLYAEAMDREAETLRRRRPNEGPVLKLANSCGTCDQADCHRHEGVIGGEAAPLSVRTAFLVDENWPEITAYVAAAARPGDILGLPLDGGRWRMARYRWPTGAFARVIEAPLTALRRSAAIRRAGVQGPGRRQAELDGAARLAARLGRLATEEVERLVVAQSLLPFLWRDGWLGGRAFEVLMTRQPIAELQRRLDAAFARHGERRTLADFRASSWLAEAEAEALAAADRIVTPHREIARQFPGRAQLLDWRLPEVEPPSHGTSRRIAFPGPTVARKGAAEVRAAARALSLEVVLLGSELEGQAFWDDVPVLRPAVDWLDGVAAVVQPAVIEDQPRRLLAALAAGVPVIATEACGLPPGPGVTLVPPGDAEALVAAIARVLPDTAAACAA